MWKNGDRVEMHSRKLPHEAIDELLRKTVLALCVRAGLYAGLDSAANRGTTPLLVPGSLAAAAVAQEMYVQKRKRTRRCSPVLPVQNESYT